MKANIPPKDNHVNIKTGARRTWNYGERKVVRIEQNADGVVIGIEEATDEGFCFLGNGHDVARIEYGRYYIIEFREGGPLKGYWAIACEQPIPSLGSLVSYKGADYSIDLLTVEKSGWTVTISKKQELDVILHVPWSHCVPNAAIEELWQKAAVNLLNRRLKPDFRAAYSTAQGTPCIEIWNGLNTICPILRLWLRDPGRTVFLMVEGVLHEYGLPVNFPDIQR